MISINEAGALGIERLRRSEWTCELDHIKIDILQPGNIGPWLHFYSPINLCVNHRDPVDLLSMSEEILSEIAYEPYVGPLPDSVEYRTLSDTYSTGV